ncbi:LysE family transporter [Leptolyngbya sp. FACHB-541]|uniref:LysE family transporter n=1 Tax=Leptolyngbya sp. FACHB-541 TaxID=2692810 RepID=UPI001686693C|nr:LysE family transporter [Leptolyngbya sp. FACHB-541]MBD1997409.1 LysE family transporter [Leptolyngbya sp. FACHB-541]
MSFFADWLTVLAIGCLAVMAPGPNLAMTLRNSLSYSRQSGIYTAVGLAAGNCVHVTYCLVGIGVIISESILLFSAIKWLGAAYLIYVGIKSLQAQRHKPIVPKGSATQNAQHSSSQQTHDLTRFASIRIGFLTNLLNPKVTLFFLALFTQIIQPTTPLFTQAIYGLTMVALEFIWFALVAIVISQRSIKNRFLAISHWTERITGAVLIALGLRLAVSQQNT